VHAEPVKIDSDISFQQCNFRNLNLNLRNRIVVEGGRGGGGKRGEGKRGREGGGERGEQGEFRV